jgi:hypothetical protein
MSITKNLTVIVINYNSLKNLKKLLTSLKKINQIIKKIIIIDNNSKEFNLSSNKKIITIKNKHNIGFAKAVNQGIKLSTTDIILLLNPDCLIIDNSPLLTYKIILKNKYIGAIGGKILHHNLNKIQFTATNKPNFLTALFEFTNIKKIFPNNQYTNSFWIEKNKNIKKPVLVYSLCGAYLFLRKNINITFNQKFFLYLEDLYLGKTLEKNKFEVWFDPNSHVSHISGSSNTSKYNIVLGHWYHSRKIYFLKFLPKHQSCLLYIIFTIEELFLKIYHFIKKQPNA